MKTPSFFSQKVVIELLAVSLAVLALMVWVNNSINVQAQLPAPESIAEADNSAVAAADSSTDALFIFSTSTASAMRETIGEIEKLGGQVINRYPPAVAWGKMPREQEAAVSAVPGVKEVLYDRVEPENLDLASAAARIGIDTWNAHFAEAPVNPDSGQPLVGDDLAPAPELQGEAAQRPTAGKGNKTRSVAGAPEGAGFYDTSEFLAGDISLGVILPESNGAIDASSENWDSVREAAVATEIQNGISWWYDREPAAKLTFTFHFYYGRLDSRAQTSYEPITRSADPYGYTGEDLWVNEIMQKFGYTDSQRLDKVRHFNNDLRDADGTDWAVTYFVADSLSDANGSFADGYFAYMWIGGPYSVMTYDNDGYGISNFDAVAAHEFGHAFYANDQYAAACTCDQHRGYLDYYNYNCENSCPHNVYSIMRGQVYPYTVGAVDMYARGQLGIIDTDRDGIIEALDATPTLNLSTTSAVVGSIHPTFDGVAAVTKVENQNPYGLGNDITISTITNVKYRVDEGEWQNASASDGHFDETSEDFDFTPTVSKGRHTIDVLAEDSFGNQSDRGTIDVTSGEGRIVTIPGVGGGPQVREFSTAGKALADGFFAYSSSLRTGARIATADVDLDGAAEIVTGPGPGAQPHVVVYEKNGAKRGVDYRPFPSSFRGGVDVAGADIDGDGKDEIVASQFTGGHQVRVYRYNSSRELIVAFSPFGNITAGVTVTSGDVDGDGKDEVIVGAGVGGGPHIRVYDIKPGQAVLKSISFFAFHPNSRTGVDVSAADTNGDGLAEIAVSQLYNGEAWIKVYKFDSVHTQVGQWRAFPAGVQCGANVEMFDVDNDGRSEVLVSPNTGGGPQVRAFEANGAAVTSVNFFAYSTTFRGGVVVTGGFF